MLMVYLRASVHMLNDVLLPSGQNLLKSKSHDHHFGILHCVKITLTRAVDNAVSS